MPQSELTYHLAANGDAPDEWLPDGVMITKKGIRYIRSLVGMGCCGLTWEPRYIWCRE